MEKMTKSFWTRQYQKHIGQMIGLCYRYVSNRETAEDLAHNAFLQAIEKADTFKGIGSFDKWLTRITVNTVLMHLREHKQKGVIDNQQDVEALADTVADEEEMSGEGMMETIRKANFTQEEIAEAISELPENHRVVLNMYIFDHFSHKQIAELRGISVNTSKSHLLRARKELQQILFNKAKKKKNVPLWPGSSFFPIHSPLSTDTADGRWRISPSHRCIRSLMPTLALQRPRNCLLLLSYTR